MRPGDEAGEAGLGTPGPAGAGPAGRARVAARGPARVRPAAPDRSLAFVVLLTVAAFVVPLLGAPLALHGTGEAAAPGAGGIAVLRTVLFAALCVPAGEAYAGWLGRRLPGVPVRPPPPSRAVPAAAAGFLAALGLACVVAAGNLVPHRLADLDVAGLDRSRDGLLALIEVNAFLLALLWARSRHPAHRLVPPAMVIAAEALRAHPSTEPSPLFGSAVTAVHLTCAVLWVGGLWQVLRTVRLWRAPPWPGVPAGAGPADGASAPAAAGSADGASSADGAGSADGAALLAAYARRAALLLAALALTGAVSTVRRMPPATLFDQVMTTAYGRTLLAKLVLVAGGCALALIARLRLTAALPRPRSAALLRGRLRTGGSRDPLTACAPARAEVAVLGVVVAVSALLTALPVPIRW